MPERGPNNYTIERSSFKRSNCLFRKNQTRRQTQFHIRRYSNVLHTAMQVLWKSDYTRFSAKYQMASSKPWQHPSSMRYGRTYDWWRLSQMRFRSSTSNKQKICCWKSRSWASTRGLPICDSSDQPCWEMPWYICHTLSYSLSDAQICSLHNHRPCIQCGQSSI